MNQKGFSLIFLLFGLISVVGIISGAYYLGTLKNKSQSQTTVISSPTPQSSSSPPPSTITTPITNVTANWKIFTSETEGFTLRYPPDWIAEDTSLGNCGHMKLNGTDCRERFDFVAPDRLRVGFVIHKDDNNDRVSCGVQSSCNTEDIKNLEILNIPTLGKVYLVSYIEDEGPGGQFNNIALHQPLDSGTTPVLGKNTHSNYWIDFSLPSKIGGRFILDVSTNTAENQNSKWTGMSYEQFYNSDSAQKAIQILKSLSY